MTIREEIEAKMAVDEEFAAHVAAQEHGLIAAALSDGRKKVAKYLGGIGTILEVLGPMDGADFLDTLDSMRASVSAVKWAWTLIDRGELDFGAPGTRMMLDLFVSQGAFTAETVASLKAVAEQPDPVSNDQVIEAMRSM